MEGNEKKELVFVTLTNINNARRGIYNNILQDFSRRFSNISVFCLGKNETFVDRNIHYYSGGFKNWPKFFKDLNVRSIYSIFITDYILGGFFSLIYAKRYNIPLVYRCGGLWRYEMDTLTKSLKAVIASILKPIILKNCKKVVYNSKSIVQHKIEHNHEVVYNGVDLEMFKPSGVENSKDNGLKILYIGRINREKGLDYLFEAAKDFKEKVSITIAGQGPLLEEYQKNYPFITFLGRVNHKDLPNLINNHDAIILPSLTNSSESFPNALLEGMACGKAILGTNVYGIPEMTHHNINGIIFHEKDVIAIKRVFSRLLEKPELLEIFGRNSRKIVESRFEKKKQMDALYNALFNLKKEQKIII